MTSNTGARFEIAIDGTPRTYRDLKELAIEAATRLKTKNVHAEVTVRDVETGETTAVKHPLAK
jgi:electron transfer flavoprotein alpha/beta subunit